MIARFFNGKLTDIVFILRIEQVSKESRIKILMGGFIFKIGFFISRAISFFDNFKTNFWMSD